MAGLWERVKSDADDRVSTHLIVAGMRAYFAYTVDNTKGATKAQVLAAINNQIGTNLTAAEQTDLDDIATALDAITGDTNKLIYLAGLEYVFIAAEMGEVNEAKWRNDLDI